MKYIVMSRDYEYNDEVYSATDSGFPDRLLNNETAAKNCAYQQNIRWIIENVKELGEYGYNIEDIFYDPETAGKILNISDMNRYNLRDLDGTISEGQAMQLLPCLFANMLPYYVCSVKEESE